MQQQRLTCFLLALILTISFAGCGGGNNTSAIGAESTITVSPATLSLNYGQFAQLTPTVMDANSHQILTLTPTYASNNAGVQVSTSGLVCGGTWNSLTTPTVCTPVNPPVPIASATITVTAGSVNTTVSVSVHLRIARITLASTAATCTSQAGTQQFTAQAFDSTGADITAQAGTFTYASSDATVATIATTGIVTGVNPGSTTISASVNGVFSLPATFITCPPASIVLSPGTFTGAAAATQQLTATVTDTLGKVLTGTALTYTSSQQAVATVTAAGLITAVGPGNSGIVASCTPPTCNPGAAANFPIYSNLVTANVTGTSATTVYVTGAKSTTIVPIDTTTNVVGTAITIPLINSVQPVVTSMVFNNGGSTAFIGTNQGIVAFNPASNTLGTPVTAAVGVVLAVSPDGKKVIVADQTPATPHTYFVDTTATTNQVSALPISTVSTAADFSVDSLKVYVVSNTNSVLSIPATVIPFTSLQLAAPANDVTFLTQGSLAFLAGGAGNSITVHVTCDNSTLPAIGTAATPLLIKSSTDSTRVFSVDTTRIYDITVSNIAAPANTSCPVTATTTLNTVSFGNTFAPKQMIVTPNASRVFVTNDQNKLMVYNATNSTASSITLVGAGTATTTGGVTQDSAQVYVGALGSNDVHRIDVTAGTDAQQIAVSLKDSAGAATSPDFVAVRPK
jgi:hypothetical protein